MIKAEDIINKIESPPKIVNPKNPHGFGGPGKPRPVKSKLAKAMIATNPAVKEIQTAFDNLNDRDRKIFVSMTSGDDELVAILKAGYYNGITTIAKIVYKKDGKPLETEKLTLDNVKELDPFSYERLLRIAKCEIKHLVGKTDYRNFIVDITDLFKLIAPEQIAVLASISGKESAKDSDRIKAAEAILDRGGYESSETKKKPPTLNPTQVNIIIGGTPKAEFNPIVTVEQGENEPTAS